MIVNPHRLGYNVQVETRTFAATDCAVVEGCVAAGTRQVLLFDAGFINIGDGDFFAGRPVEWPLLFKRSACHGQWEFIDGAGYELLTTNGTVVVARKQEICFRDETPALTNAGSGKYTCEDLQGITIGWEDVYDRSFPCQYLDITGVPAGQYILRVVVNPDAVLHESNFLNNSADVLITLGTPGGGGGGQTNQPPICQTNKPPKCVNHDDWKKWWDWKKLKDKFKGKWIKKCKVPRCTCHCHNPPDKPGNGHGNGEDDDDHGGGNGGGKGDDDDHGGNGGGKDDDDDHGNGGGKDDDDDHGGGKDGGKDDDDDHGNNCQCTKCKADKNKGGGKGNGGGNGGGKGQGKDDGKGKGNGNGKDDGKGKGNDKDNGKGKGGGKNDADCKPAPAKGKGKK